MSVVTYSTIRDFVERKMDLEDETMIKSQEMMDLCNEAIHEAESIILSLNEDYFMTKSTITLVPSQSDYDLPTDIYANKIRAIIHDNGAGSFYPVKRMRFSNRFEEIPYISSGDDYRYLLINDSVNGFKIRMYPTPSTATTLTVWYLRNAAQIDDDNDVVEIPEFRSFIEKYMCMKCAEKEANPMYEALVLEFEKEKQLMIESLTERVADDDNTLEVDLSVYREHS